MKLALYKFTNDKLNKVEIYVFDDDLVDVVYNEIQDTFGSIGIKPEMFNIDCNYCLNFGTPRTIYVKTYFNFGELDEPMVWKQVEQDLLKYDEVVLTRNDLVYF